MVGVRPELTHQRVGMMRVLDLLGVKSAQLQLLLLPFLLFGGSLGIRSEDLELQKERKVLKCLKYVSCFIVCNGLSAQSNIKDLTLFF